jgi:hypothetical protein
MFEQDPEPQLTGPQRELERALSGLTPAPPRLSAKDVRAAALLARQRRHTRLWQAVAAALAVGLATLALTRPAPRAIEPQRIVYVTLEKPPAPPPGPVHVEPAPPIPAGFAYLRMRQRVLLLGADALRSNRPAVTSTHAAPSARWAPGGADVPPAGDAPRPTFLDLLLPGGKT